MVAKKASSKKAKAGTAKKSAKRPAKRTSARRPAGKAASAGAAKAGGRAKEAPAKKRQSGRPAASPLAKAQLKEFRRLLLEKRTDLVGDMNGAEHETLRTSRQEGTGDLSNLPTHPADVGTDNYEQEFTLGLLESERVLLTEIEALGRIEGGTYGICLGTGQAISKARLRARPWAKYCIEYARLVEKGLASPDETGQEDQNFDENE